MHVRHRAILTAFVLTLFCVAAARPQAAPADRIVSPIVAAARTVTNGVEPLATRQNDLGRVAGSEVFHRMVLLLRRSAAQEAELEELLKEQQDPTSPQYHQWLTPAEFGQRFGPSDGDLAAIEGWLRSQGFSVEPAPNGRQWLLFTGTSAQVESAFATQMHHYAVNGKAFIANATPASVPTALAPDVRGVASLSSYTAMTPQYHLAANPTIEIQNTALTGPADLSAIYDAAPLAKANVLGQGQSIALIEESNIDPQDLTDFRTIAKLPPATLNVIVNGPDPGTIYGEETEAIADVEYAGALAPDATLNVIVTASTEFNQGIDLSTAYAVDNDISPITSLSYAGCETLNDTYAASTVELYALAYEQGAAEGISQFVAAGDYGGDTCGYTGLSAGYGVNAIGDTPWNVSVGGTEFIMPDANEYFPPPGYTATGYIPESTWNDYENPEDGRPLAGGGGVSINWTKPAWQTGPGVPADGARDVPDVSLLAGDNLAYMVCESDQGGECAQGYALGIIGTSLASPSWAGIQALVNQQNNLLKGAGNPDPTYYKLAAGANSPFHDITVGDTKVPDDCLLSLIAYCPGGTNDLVGYEATTGYDLATGLGSVDVNKLATDWQPPTGSGTATVSLTVSANSITHGDPLTANISVTASGSTAPTGDVVLMAGTQGVIQLTLNSSGNATVTFGTASGVELPGGSYTLTAHYAGDTNFAAANSNAEALTVNPEPTATQAASGLTGPIVYGTAVTISAATAGVNSGTGYPVPGTYTFSDGANTLGTAVLASTGESFAYATKGTTASLTLSGSITLDAGTHQITVASPAASASFLASTSAPVSVVVNKGPVLVSLTPDYTNPAVNSTVKLAVVVMNVADADSSPYETTVAVTGNVDFYDTSTSPKTKLGTVTLAGGAGTLSVTFSSAGLHTVMAQYDGDANDLANVSGAADITVGGKTPTSTTLSGLADFTYAPAPISLTATVIGDTAGTAPTGTVTFTDATANNGAGATISTVTLGTNGVATLNTATLAAGTHSITATYSGDSNYTGSTAVAEQVSVIAMTLTPSSTSASLAAGQNTTSIPLTLSTNPIFTNYYYANVSLSCSGLPTGAACVFSPSSVISPAYNSSTGVLSGTSAFTIYTTGPTLTKASNAPPRKPWDGAAPLALAGLLALGLPLAFRRRRYFAAIAGSLLLVFFLGLNGCGGAYNISSPGTPAGTYAVTVTGTMIDGGFGTFTETATFNLTVTAAGQ